MRLTALFVSAAVLGGMALSAQATVGWANIQWPWVGSPHASNTPITVYSRVWKGGCTDLPGPCADLVATLYYKMPSEGSYTGLPMFYFGDPGDAPNNDELLAQIPVSALGESTVQFYIEYTDLSDMSTYYPDGYSITNPAWYEITAATVYDFELDLCLDLSCTTIGDPGVSGTFNGWSFTGLQPSGDPDVWCTKITIPAGSNPALEFKFRNPPVQDWENVSNRTYAIPHEATDAFLYFFWDDISDCPSSGTVDMPGSFSLSPAYPNPFNPSTTIEFSMAATSQARLVVSDLAGRTVATLVDGLVAGGQHSVVFDASGLASGVYVYTLASGGHSESRKLVLLK
jgi:hypothetical protein